MDFADGLDGRMSSELSRLLQPELRQMLYSIDNHCAVQKMPGVICTQLVRTVEEQIEIYVPYWKKLVARMESGEHLAPALAKLAMELTGKTDDELKDLAIAKFTWHYVRCAADIRIRHWTPAQLKVVVTFVTEETRDARQWEFLVHDVAGPHMHIGIRDFSFRAKFDPRKGVPT